VTPETVIGIDIGTSSTKGVVTTLDGAVVARAQRPHRVSFPRPGWAEHDAEAIWWNDFVSVCAELAPAAGSGVGAVCVSGIGPCAVPCDDNLRPLRPAILYGIDSRATAEITEVERMLGHDAILRRSGSALSSQALGPKLLWLRRHEPEIWAATRGWYMASSFVAARLTGAYVLDHHSASQCNPLYDLAAGKWADDWAEELVPGVPLPELVWPSDVVGAVTPEAARATGLPAGTPVAAGTIDSWAEAFSVGVRQPGDLMLMYGSTMFLIQVVTEPTPTPMLWTTNGAEPGPRTLAAGMSTSGSLTEWVRELVGSPPWAELLGEAEATPAGARGLLILPYFAGERTPIYDPKARGVVAGLTLSHGRAELLRAVYEATAYGTRQILEAFRDAAPTTPRIVAVGGGTKAPLWMQIISDVTGVQQSVPRERSGASYGDALLAAIATKQIDATTDWSLIEDVVYPSPTERETYEELFVDYRSLYTATAPIVHRLAERVIAKS
jgi:xylulokinase